MNKYEELFLDIANRTKLGVLKWKQLRRQANSSLILHPNIVFRQFEATLFREEVEYTLLLIEKKYDDPMTDFVFEKHELELLVLNDGELVATLSDSVIEYSQLSRLTNLVETKSDKASKLFAKQDAS